MATNQKTYQAFCLTCGWEGRTHTTKTDAVIDGDAHEINAADPLNIHDHHSTEVRPSL
jgi:hypothetical protein